MDGSKHHRKALTADFFKSSVEKNLDVFVPTQKWLVDNLKIKPSHSILAAHSLAGMENKKDVKLAKMKTNLADHHIIRSWRLLPKHKWSTMPGYPLATRLRSAFAKPLWMKLLK